MGYSKQDPNAPFDDSTAIIESVAVKVDNVLTIASLKEQIVQIDLQISLWDQENRDRIAGATKAKNDILNKINEISLLF